MADGLVAAERGDEADEAFGGTVTRHKVPPHARAVPVGRGHRFAAYPRCSADSRETEGPRQTAHGQPTASWCTIARTTDRRIRATALSSGA